MKLFVIEFNKIKKYSMEQNIGYIGVIIALIFPLPIRHFLYFLRHVFCCKNFKNSRIQWEVRFSDFVGEFFLIWFYIIGIRILQPK